MLRNFVEVMIVAAPLMSRELKINPHGVRLTASEPNMLKVRLKARVIERRASPLARRPLKTRIKQRSEFHFSVDRPVGAFPFLAAKVTRPRSPTTSWKVGVFKTVFKRFV